MAKNKKCPWCKSDGRELESVVVRDLTGNDIKRYIECKGCKARGPEVSPDKNPWTVWNYRK